MYIHNAPIRAYERLPFQIDSSKVKPGENVEENMTRLIDVCQSIMDTIYSTVSLCPP